MICFIQVLFTAAEPRNQGPFLCHTELKKRVVTNGRDYVYFTRRFLLGKV